MTDLNTKAQVASARNTGGSKDNGDLLLQLANGQVDFVTGLDPATGISSADELFLVQADGTTKSLTLAQLLGYLAPLLGTGTGGDPEVPPTLPPTASFVVPENRPDGAIIGYVDQTVVGAPAATWSMTPLTGVDIMTATGDMFLEDAAAFFAAAGTDTVTTTVTATNSAGSAVVDVSFTAGADYDELPIAYDANRIMHFDILDNREIRYDAASGLVTLVGDRSPENRDATNAQEKMNYVLNSNLGAGKPAVRGNGATGPTSGMFYTQNPVWRGIRGVSIAAGSTADSINVGIDQMYKNGSTGFPNESALQSIFLAITKNSMLNQPCLLTIIAEGDTMIYRINGTQVGTQTLQSYNQPQYPVIGFFLVYLTGIATGGNSITNTGTIGQDRSWKAHAINGDIGLILQYLNASASFTPTSGFPDASTTGTTGALTAVPASATSGTGWAWDSDDQVLRVSGAATTLQNIQTSNIVVEATATGSIIQNCRVIMPNASFTGIDVNCDDVTIQDCKIEVVSDGLQLSAVVIETVDNCIVRRCDISGVENGVVITGKNITIRDNYMHNLKPYDIVTDPHVDGIQFLGTTTDNDGCLIENNNIIMTDATSAIIMNDTGAAKNVRIVANRLIGAGYTVYIWPDDTNALLNNRIAGGGYGYYTVEGSGTGTPTISGNVDDTSGAPI